MICDLTGMELANAGLLDEATAAAEAMIMMHNSRSRAKAKANANVVWVDEKVWPQTLDVLITRANPLGIELKVADWKNFELDENTFGVLVQYPNSDGQIVDYSPLVKSAHEKEIFVSVAADLLSLSILTPPGEWDADIVFGSAQRFGVPMGYGGPHAAFFASKDAFKRTMPGRIIGVSKESRVTHGPANPRTAHQTRKSNLKYLHLAGLAFKHGRILHRLSWA
jgi:glycine dehydrogenase